MTNNKAAEPTTPTTASFGDWLYRVSDLTLAKFGVTYEELPDLLFVRSAYNDGVSPEEFFEEDVVPMVREEFGSIVDDL